MNLDEPGAPEAQKTASAVGDWLSATAPAAPDAAAAPSGLARAATVQDMFDLAAPEVKPVVARLVPVDGKCQSIEILHGEDVTKIGRSKDLPESLRLGSMRLSSFHAELHLAPATNVVTLVDTSTNGVWLNLARVTKGSAIELSPGDSIRLLNPASKDDDGPRFEFLFQQVRPKASASSLVDELTCSICKCVYYRPVSVIPCLHTFCGHCISAWIKTGAGDCAECRSKMREVRPSHKIASVVADLIKAKPEHAKSATECAQLDSENTIPAVGLVLGKRERSDDGLGYDDEEDEEEDSDSDAWAAAPAAVPYKLPMFFAAPPTSCPQCATPSALDGFTCPPHGPHLRCFLCKSPFPRRPLCDVPQECDLCGKAFCDLYLGGCRNPQGVGYLQPVGDHAMSELPLGSLFLGNTVEQGILLRYLETAKVDVPTLWALCVEKLKSGEWVPDITSVRGPLKSATVCAPCAQRVFSSLLYHFRRAIPRDSLPPTVTARPDCWYGIQCRTMRHSTQHAQAYNHVCPNVKRKE